MGQRRLDDFADAGGADGGSDASPGETAASEGDAGSEATDDGRDARAAPGTGRSAPGGDGDGEEDSDRSEAEGLTAGPAAVTVSFTPGGAPCEACGERVERRWRDGDAKVCAACKAW